MKGIYKITSPSGRIYIGQSKDIEKRFSHYKRYKCKSQNFLYNSFKKYKVKNHLFEILAELPEDIEQEVIDNYEIVYISLYKAAGAALINVKEGGKGGGRGQKMTEEEKYRLGERMKGNKLSLGHKNALGTKRTQEHRKERSNLWKKGAYDCLLKSIKCNETGLTFSSIVECVREMNLPKYSEAKISQSLLGKRKKQDVHGYTFSYFSTSD